jgi:hypothetical protein
MSKSIYIHYVYRITNILLNKHYYGSRSCKNCHPKDDLGIKYFSSSRDKDFIKDQKEHPKNYKYKIIKIFDSRKDALKLEIFLHEKFNVGINEHFYNRSKQTSVGWSTVGILPSEETRKKLSDAQKGKNLSEEIRKKISEVQKGEKNHFYGKHHSEETRKKIAEASKNRKHTEESKKKISEAKKGEKHHFYGKKFSEEHRIKLSKALIGNHHSEDTKKKMSEAKKGENNHLFKGYYVTPFGNFSSSRNELVKEHNIGRTTLKRWCKNNNTFISKLSYRKSKYLQENFDEFIIGKTFADIGFSFEAK